MSVASLVKTKGGLKHLLIGTGLNELFAYSLPKLEV